MSRQYNREEDIIIRVSPDSRELDERRRDKFLNPIDGLTVVIMKEGRRGEICTIDVEGGILSTGFSQLDKPSDRAWPIELRMSNPPSIAKEDLKNFMVFMVSGYLKITESRIWTYFILACAFQTEAFITSMMSYPLVIDKQQIVRLCLGGYFRFLKKIRLNTGGQQPIPFFQWLVGNNPTKFRMADLVENTSEDVQIEILECKAMSGNLSLSELRSLEDSLRRYYASQQRQGEYTKTLKIILPHDYLTIDAVEHFRGILYSNDRAYMDALKRIRQSLITKQSNLQKNQKKLKQTLEAKRSELERTVKDYYISELDAVLDQDRRANPSRYTRPREQPRQNPRPVEKEEGQWEQPPYQVSKFKEESNVKNGKKNKNKSKEQLEMDQAMADSLKDQPPAPPPIRIKAAAKRQPHNNGGGGCSLKERVQMDCGCSLCLGCIVNFYFDRTDIIDFDEPLDWRRCQGLKFPVDCWNCRKAITQDDIRQINRARGL